MNPRVLLALGVLALVALVVLVQRPAGDSGTDGPTAGPEPTATAEPTITRRGDPATATDEELCVAFRALAERQAQFVAGTADDAELEEAADALVETGVPAGMSLPARSGYYALIGSLYDSVGVRLEPEAVGAAAAPLDGGDAAFSAYLQGSCPP